MATSTANKGAIARAQTQRTAKNNGSSNTVSGKSKGTISTMLNALLDSENYRKRFDELLGARAPQFISSIITLVNADTNLQKAFYESPQTVIQAALKAATYDLPIDPSLGFAYIVPFNNSKKLEDGTWQKRMEANFILGYKGMIQLCLRTGAYARVPDAVDVREGELVSYDRLTGDCEFKWVEDEDEREKLPIIGYAGYFRLKNGAEKTIYMTKKQVENHEKKNRKGRDMGKGWREDFDNMAKKTVIRRLVGKYGLMSIDYRTTADPATVAAATAVASGVFDDDDSYIDGAITGEFTVMEDTGEVIGDSTSVSATAAEAETVTATDFTGDNPFGDEGIFGKAN